MRRATALAVRCVTVSVSLFITLAGPATAAPDADLGARWHEGRSTPPAAIPPVQVAAILPERPRWWRCGEAGTTNECAWLEVPLDHADPESPTIRLPASRIRALDEARRAGVLVTIAGGPGQRGTDGVRAGAHTAAIHERFDIVSWDPRGTSRDTLIDCIPQWDPFVGLDRTPDTAAERAALDRRAAELAMRCRAAHGHLLPYVGTFQTALDLERLRRMLDEPRISILGTSYGSQVAVVYATLFPDHVRALVVDGYSDPNLSPGLREIEQAASFERALDELLAGCASDLDCPFHSRGEPGSALDRLLEQLDAAPLPTDRAGGGSLTQSDAHEAIVGSLTRDARARQRLLAALASAAQGRGGPLLGIADDVRRNYEASGLNQATFMAVTCADTAAYWDDLPADEVARIATRVREVAPRLGAWLWTPPAMGGLPPIALCAMQPRPASPPPGPIDAASAGPVLVLASSGDPTTPIEGARRAIQDLERAVLVTLDADHHLAYHFAAHDPGRPEHRCLLEIVEAYLIDLEIPRDGTTCAADWRP